MSEAPLINFIELTRDDIEIAESEKLPNLIKANEAREMLRAAEIELERKEYEAALTKYHMVLDAAPSSDLKQLALKGMESIKSSKSLSRLAKYCRDDDPILWNYQEPDPELQNSAYRVFIAIANDTAESNRDKAIRMLKQALKVQDKNLYEQVASSLKKLDVVIEGESS
jgi:tetratricopeptide (TPR) repeat protein